MQKKLHPFAKGFLSIFLHEAGFELLSYQLLYLEYAFRSFFFNKRWFFNKIGYQHGPQMIFLAKPQICKMLFNQLVFGSWQVFTRYFRKTFFDGKINNLVQHK